MPTLPATLIAVLRCFASLFSARVWEHAQVLLLGAILAPAQRTVAATLRLGIDETVERRRSQRIAAKGLSRDPVRSRRRHVVNAIHPC